MQPILATVVAAVLLAPAADAAGCCPAQAGDQHRASQGPDNPGLAKHYRLHLHISRPLMQRQPEFILPRADTPARD